MLGSALMQENIASPLKLLGGDDISVTEDSIVDDVPPERVSNRYWEDDDASTALVQGRSDRGSTHCDQSMSDDFDYWEDDVSITMVHGNSPEAIVGSNVADIDAGVGHVADIDSFATILAWHNDLKANAEDEHPLVPLPPPS